MWVSSTLLVLSVLCVSAVELPPPHYVTRISFYTALQECAEYFQISENLLQQYISSSYPDDPSVHKLVRCSLMLLGCWDDITGMRRNVIENFFEIDPNDRDHVRRTNECIRKSTTEDVSSPAYVAFLCYHQQFGNFKLHSKRFVPFGSHELKQLVEMALNVAELPWFVPAQYATNDILYEPHFPPVLYFIFVRGGFYNAKIGFDLRNLFTQFGVEELLKADVEQCLANVVHTEKVNGHESIVIKGFQKCLAHFIPLLEVVQDVARSTSNDRSASVKACTGLNPSTQPPFYNRACED